MSSTFPNRIALFRDRIDAGQQLASVLQGLRGRADVLVLALPRGGVPVAAEIASTLGLPIDVLNVKKLGLPGREEVAMGAVASGGVVHLDDYLIRGLGISHARIADTIANARKEIVRREDLYRQGRPFPSLLGKTVLLVDDGIATGSTMHAAISAVRQLGCYRVIVAVPVASAAACEELAPLANDLVALFQPENLLAINQWYGEFPQVGDEQVLALLGVTVEQGA